MIDPARYKFAFHDSKLASLLFVAVFTAANSSFGFVCAEPNPFSAIDGRADAASDLSYPTEARRFRSTILALDSSVSDRSARGACELAKKQACEELVQDNILWRIDDPENSASRHWQQKNLDDLCACTSDPYETVNCFQIQVNNSRKSWQEAIATCRAKP
ncbi:MAG: hypothetical protein AB7F41_15215 [Methylocystis sp.]|uniref:hypothetical protein n=1 Tax=Methylocystis sp. TaxID=1911079 RepID=UPI003D0DE2F2